MGEVPRGLTASSSTLDSTRHRQRVTATLAGLDPLWFGAVPAVCIYGLFVLWPMGRLMVLALESWNGYGWQHFVGLQNLSTLLSDPLFRIALQHSVGWEVAACVAPGILGLALALLARHSRMRGIFLAALFLPVLLPATAVATIWLLVYSPAAGLLTNLLAVFGLSSPDWLGDPGLALGALFAAWLWTATGVAALLFYTGLLAIGREYYEVAIVEGAGALWRFRHVTLPGLWRSTALAVLISIALSAQVFDLVFVTTGGGPGYATMILPVDMYGRAFGGHVGEGAMVACIQTVLGLLPAAAVLLLSRRGESLDTGETAGTPSTSWIWTGILAGVTALFLLPLGWLLLNAVQPGRAFLLNGGPTWDISTWDGGNLSGAWQAGMDVAVRNSLLIAMMVVVLVVILALPAAFLLTRSNNRPLRLGSAVLLVLGLLQPMSVLIIPLFSILHDLRLLDSPWGIILPEVARSLPAGILVLWGFMSQLPDDLFAAGAVDGAGLAQQLRYLAVPLVRPALAVVTIWTFVLSWSEYLLPTVVSQDGSLQTVPTLLGSFIGRYNTQFGLLAAGTLMAILPSLLLYLAVRKPAARALSSLGKVSS